MHKVVISGTGLYTPPFSISNDELVESFNSYVRSYNDQHADAIAKGEVEALSESSSAFIEKASGIKSRFVVNKEGILDPQRMAPRIPERSNEDWASSARWRPPPRSRPYSAPAVLPKTSTG